MSDQLDQLERLAKLREQGVLSEQEFAAQKAQLLAGTSSSAPSVPAPDPTRTVSGHKKVSGKQAALMAAAVVALCAVLLIPGMLNGRSGGSSPPKSNSDNTTMAFVMCKDFVTKRLKSPATADFPTLNGATINGLGGNRYKVSSYVDSENGFGANVRTDFVCTVKKESDGDTWTLEDLITTQR